MSFRSEVMDVLNGKPAARIPWFGDLSYYYYSLSRRGVLEKKYEGPYGEKRFYADFGVGIYLYTPDVFKTEYRNLSYTETKDDQRIVQQYKTPVGDIESIQTYVNGQYCYAYNKHFVETIDDFRVMLYVHENSVYKENYEPFLLYDKIWGEDGICFAMAMASMAPLQKLLARWAGMEKTIELYMDYPDEFEQIFTSIEQSQEGLVEVLTNSPAPVVILPENLSSEVTGASFFKRFNMPYYKKITQKLHSAGKKVALHIDGSLVPCLGMLSECGFDIADAVTPKPFGDVAIEDLRQTAGEDIIIWGGLPGGIFSSNYSEQFFEDHLKKAIDHADMKFVLGVADQVPPDAIPSRIRRVREMVNTHLRS